MKRSIARIWGGLFVACTMALAGCVGEPVEESEAVEESETALTAVAATQVEESDDEAGDGTVSPMHVNDAMRGTGTGTNLSSDPDPNPWVPPKNPDEETPGTPH